MNGINCITNLMTSTTEFVNNKVEFIKNNVNLHYIYMAIRPALKFVIDTAYYEQQLMKAIVKDDRLIIRNCFYYGADLNNTRCHLYGHTPLMFAVTCESQQALEEFIELGADINKHSSSRDKVTALYLACRERYRGKFSDSDTQFKIMNTLLSARANPNIVVKGGTSPLMEVCFQSNLKAVELLLSHGANPNFIDESKNTALDLCLAQKPSNDQQQIAIKLKEAGALSAREIKIQPSYPIHPKINADHLFKSGLLLPNQAINALCDYKGEDKKLKKYTTEIPSLFRSVLIGKSNYILYDSHQFFTTCPGCLNGISPHNYLGKGGEAKVKIVQDCATGVFFAARITKHLGCCELEILKLLNCFVDYIKVGHKHYIIQKLHKGVCLFDYKISQSKLATDVAIIKIMKNLLKQIKILHENGYIHRDIASDNVMIDPETLEINYIDFGASIKKKFLFNDNGFTLNRIEKGNIPLAPELENPNSPFFPYSEQSDIFAIGIIFSELIDQIPFSHRRLDLLNMQAQMTSEDPSERKDAQYYINLLNEMETQN